MPKVLILDYSTDKESAVQIGQWLPTDAEVTPRSVDGANSLEAIDLTGFTHIIHSGSALSIVDEAPFTAAAHRLIRDAEDQGIPQFGICYGLQLLCQALVGPHAVRHCPPGVEAGWSEVEFTPLGQQRLGVGQSERVWIYHYDEVTDMPAGSELIAGNSHTRVHSFVNDELKLLGTQFHPEFDLEAGNQLFLDDRDKLTAKGYDVDEMVKGTPSIDAGKVFFAYFMTMR